MADLDEPEAAVRNAAVRLLGRREHSRLELERKLSQRGHPKELIEGVIDALAGAGLQSDERFVENFVRSAIARGQGPLKIRAGLRERGVDDATASAFLDRDVAEWRELADAAVNKRFGPSSPVDRTDWAKRARFLASRGFSSDVAARVIGELNGLP